MMRGSMRLPGASYLIEHFRVANEDPCFARHGQSVFKNSKIARRIGTSEKTRDPFAEFGQWLSQSQLARQTATVTSPLQTKIFGRM